MWCRNCQQDVPGIAAPDDSGVVCCARCNTEIAGSEVESATAGIPWDADSEPASEFVPHQFSAQHAQDQAPVTSLLDEWELDDDVRSAQRILGSLSADGQMLAAPGDYQAAPSTTSSSASIGWQLPPGYAGGMPPLRVDDAHSPAPKKRVERRSSPLAWLALSLGLMAFVCGVVLLIWAYATARPDLWSLGIPLTLSGQAGLLLGLVMQLEGLWQTNRKTSDTLGDLDDRLKDLRHTTTMMGTTHSSAAQSFYAHMAEGASPQIMLADLKGQLDLLAMKMSRP